MPQIAGLAKENTYTSIITWKHQFQNCKLNQSAIQKKANNFMYDWSLFEVKSCNTQGRCNANFYFTLLMWSYK